MKIIEDIKKFIKESGQNDLDFVINQEEIDEIGSNEIIRAGIKKFRKRYILILVLIIFFEIMMIIRGLAFFDFTKMRRILYMVCYVLLLLFSVLGLVFMTSSYKRNVVRKAHVRIVYAYCIFLTIWSAGVSLLDIYGGHTPIVFMTVVMGTAALAFIKPTLYISIVTPLSAFMLWFGAKYGSILVSNSGYPINFLVFIVFTFFIISRQFNQNKRDYVVMKKLEQLSYHDQLTGLKNRYALHQALDGFGNVFYFGIFDFDNFKIINDAKGHDFGDGALCEVANLLTENFNGYAFRYGGDEFVVVSTDRKDEILRRCLSINENLKNKYHDVNVQLSGGFYLPRSKDENHEDYLKYADRALYQAKTQGKARFVFYEEE